MTARASAPRILLTGFGPFPGCPHNISGDVAASIASRLRDDLKAVAVAETLPVDWAAAPLGFRRIADRVRPDIALLFGVSSRARRLTIEARARNVARQAVDNSGAMPGGAVLLSNAPALYRQEALARRARKVLADHGIDATVSTDAGGYLCNAIYFHALNWSAETTGLACLLVHLPMRLSDDGIEDGGTLSRTTAVDAGVGIARHLLQRLPKQKS